MSTNRKVNKLICQIGVNFHEFLLLNQRQKNNENKKLLFFLGLDNSLAWIKWDAKKICVCRYEQC